MNLVLEYTGTVPEARSVVRLRGPYRSPSRFERLAVRNGHWQGLPVALLAQDLWRSAMEHSVAVHVPYPSGMHLSLIVQFAIDYWTEADEQGGPLRIRGHHPFADLEAETRCAGNPCLAFESGRERGHSCRSTAGT